LGSSAWIQAYLEQRQADRRASLDMTHSLVQWFGIDQFAVRQARGLGLQILGMLPPLKRHWMRKLSFGQR
jgi:2-polyprenyl-6-methoxyphenol hydroxylase-like FAD-dependent oxidoreductase